MKKKVCKKKNKMIKRQRKGINILFRELGPLYARRAYRMEVHSFWKLNSILTPCMDICTIPKNSSPKLHKNGAPNGIVKSSTHLSMALRFFAGGCPYDISLSHGVSHSTVYNSIERVIKAINNCQDLNIVFPEDHKIQKKIANGFCKASQAGFSNCIGTIDGVLIWIEKPTKSEAEYCGVGPKKFYCGRKHKFGLNMQAVCDHHGRFIDVSIGHPGSTSDYLSFSTSYFQGVSSGTKYDYNFYHSQVRIKIECAFGMLTQRFGILWKPFSANFGISKTTAAVVALCKLHNFCINQSLNEMENESSDEIPTELASDTYQISLEGGIHIGDHMQLLDGGHHNDDTTSYYRRRLVDIERARHEIFPRETLYKHICNENLRRPTPAKWRGK